MLGRSGAGGVRVALCLWSGSDARRRIGALFGHALLITLTGGATLAALAGSRRSATAFHLETPVHDHSRALGQRLGHFLGEDPPGDDVEERRLLGPLVALLATPASGSCTGRMIGCSPSRRRPGAADWDISRRCVGSSVFGYTRIPKEARTWPEAEPPKTTSVPLH